MLYFVIPIACFMYTIQLKGSLWNVLYKTLTSYTNIPSQCLVRFYKKKVKFTKKHVVLPKRFLLAHPLRLPLRLQDSLLLLAGTATWLGNPRPKTR